VGRAPTSTGTGGTGGAGDLPAGDFTAWLAAIGGVLAGTGEADVPCGGCTACCASSQFVPIEPDETDTLAHVPAPLLFPAPRRPRGHVLLGYDERGRCPMLTDEGCSIYEHRPRACRAYDCRVFAAAGVDVDGDRPLLAARARRWRFDHAGPDDLARHDAVRAAATHLRSHPDEVGPGRGTASGTGLAVRALAVHEAFLRRDGGGLRAVADPDPGPLPGAVASGPGRADGGATEGGAPPGTDRRPGSPVARFAPTPSEASLEPPS
jgi:hypothetical protein